VIEDRVESAAPLYTELLARGLKVMIYTGQFDLKDGVRSTLEWTKLIEFPGRSKFDEKARSVYTYTSD